MESSSSPRTIFDRLGPAGFCFRIGRAAFLFRAPLSILLIVGLTVFLVSCGTPIHRGKDQIWFGLAAGSTGINGATLAADEINLKGGIDGRQLKLDITDT